MSDSAFGRIHSSPQLSELYRRLRDELDQLGDYQVQHKKSALHLTRGDAFMTVRPAADGLLLLLVTEQPLQHPRVHTVGHPDHHAHNEVAVRNPADIDDDLLGWLRLAYDSVSEPDPRP